MASDMKWATELLEARHEFTHPELPADMAGKVLGRPLSSSELSESHRLAPLGCTGNIIKHSQSAVTLERRMQSLLLERDIVIQLWGYLFSYKIKWF